MDEDGIIDLSELIAGLEDAGSVSRKPSRADDARRAASEVSALFERIRGYHSSFKAEMEPDSGVGRTSKGYAHGAFRDAMRIIELCVDGICAGHGICIPRSSAAGARKKIALWLLETGCNAIDRSRHAFGEIRRDFASPGHGEGTRRSDGMRRGRHAFNALSGRKYTADDYVWLRRRVKNPGADIEYDDLRIEIERAINIAETVYSAFRGELNIR